MDSIRVENVAWNVDLPPQDNTGTKQELLESDLLLKSCKIFSVALRLSYAPNASNKAQNRLRIGEQWVLDLDCVAAAFHWVDSFSESARC